MGSAYVKALLRSRATGHALGRQAIGRINMALQDALRELPIKDANPLTAARARSMERQITGILNEFTQISNSAARDSVRLTATRIAQIHQRVTNSLLEAEGLIAKVGKFDNVNVRAVAAIGSRARNASTFRSLINRHMSDAAPEVDRILTSAVARGVSSSTTAKAIEQVMRGNFPDLREFGLRRTDLSGLRTIGYDARMIAITETNNAMREANLLSLKEGGIVSAARWQTSGSHGDPDECDELAEQDNGFGPGYFLLEDWPVAPHPHCGCYPGDVIWRPPSEWGLAA